MIRVSVMYPNQPGARFDMDYYTQKHIPMVKEQLGPRGLVSIYFDKGISSPDPSAPPQYSIMTYLEFNTVEEVHDAFKATGRQIMGDIPNYTDVTPQVQISEIVG